MIRAKQFRNTLHNISKKRQAEIESGTWKPKPRKPLRKASKKSASLWSQARKECLGRDNYRCVLCKSNTLLHCHHFQFTRTQRPDLKYTLDNLCILCDYCHNKAHNTKDSYREYKEKIFAALHREGTKIRDLERISE